MREEFETWYQRKIDRLPLALGSSPLRYAGGQYVNDFAQLAWMAWADSRAALVVELPDDRSLSASDDPWSVQDWCKAAVEGAGVTVTTINGI